MKRSIAVVSFLLWTGIILSIYYVVQKPGLLNAFAGLVDTLWTLTVAALLVFNGYAIGSHILVRVGLRTSDEIDGLLLGAATGLGALGLLGLVFSIVQIARAPIFFFFLIGLTIFFLLNGSWRKFRTDLSVFAAYWNLSFSQYSFFTRLALTLLFTFPFLLSLAPQFEAFDALLYHFAQPARVLQDGGLRLVNVPHFWFPNLTENVYLWALALQSERAAQLMHFTWAFLSALLLWRWAVKVCGVEIGRKALLLLAAIPSLPMLASWAYADMALVFYAIATLYAVTFFESTKSSGWLWVAGIMAGFAMTTKYTSFTVPLAAGLLLLVWRRRALSEALVHATRFSLTALVIAAPWYVRNAVFMGNPFYPFGFGGEFWDAFRAEWYASPGTGIGWDISQLFMLPLNVILGYRDENFYDGRLGPLLLLLAPLAVWILLGGVRDGSVRGKSLQAIGLFCLLSFGAWTFGVISTRSLWQARLLFPAAIPFAIPAALGWDALKACDSSRFRISFFSNIVIAAVIALTLFDNGMFVLQRNPLAVAFGAQS
ncbi:MAG TPA: glycosyltransferase family 39 protein, partial [Anaerolineales bacterium]|nr:glycosyltransferase family 39 protein [Anaerolineales bacterium]